MRILFYLPVVTPWWFDRLVSRLIRACAADAEVHVIVPPLWQNTGIGADQLMKLEQLMNGTHLDHIVWHIWDVDGHEAIRTSAAEDAALLALIDEIDADYTICRSADIETPGRFPGTVRFLMEGGVPILPCPAGWEALDKEILQHGMMPDLDLGDRERLESAFLPVWERMTAAWAARADPAGREAFCARVGLPADRKIIAMTLEYEHPENFFAMHRQLGDNVAIMREMAARLDDRFILAVTNHPLNIRHLGNRRLERAVAELGDRVRLVPEFDGSGSATNALLPYSDGLIVEDSKSIAIAALHGVPIHRVSRFRTGEWMHAYQDLDAFLAAVAEGKAAAASPRDTRLWLASHVANKVMDLPFEGMGPTIADVIDQIERHVSTARIDRGIARFGELAAALEAA